MQLRPFQAKLTPEQLDEYRTLVRDFASFASANNLAWSPVCGSLLAAYRHDSVMIPWDDDFDVALTTTGEQRMLALSQHNNALTSTLRVADCGFRPNEGGALLKVYNVNASAQFSADRYGNAVTFGWPFVDVWIGCTKDVGPMGCAPLSREEAASLRPTRLADGCVVPLPQVGPRSKRSFTMTSLLTHAVDTSWVHSRQREGEFVSPNHPTRLATALRLHRLRSRRQVPQHF